LKQSLIDDAVDEWPTRLHACVRTNGGHFEHTLWLAALRNRCGHYIFCPVSFFFPFSSPNLSRRRLDVYHTSAHGVALVRIYNAGLKCTARSSLKIQDAKIAKKSPSGHHRTTLSGCIFATKAYTDNRKKTVKQQYLRHMSS